jgi:hypothetical protein
MRREGGDHTQYTLWPGGFSLCVLERHHTVLIHPERTTQNVNYRPRINLMYVPHLTLYQIPNWPFRMFDLMVHPTMLPVWARIECRDTTTTTNNNNNNNKHFSHILGCLQPCSSSNHFSHSHSSSVFVFFPRTALLINTSKRLLKTVDTCAANSSHPLRFDTLDDT